MAKKFSYQAKNKQGKLVTGTVEATDKKIATEMVSRQDLRPIIVKEEKTGFDPNNLQFNFLKSSKVKSKDLVIFTRQLSTMINAGVPLVRALSTLQAQTVSESLRGALELISKDVESGLAFADSIEKHPKVFSPVYINMVRAGEAGGILDDILKRLATQQEKEASMKKKIKSASTYPVILLVITVIAFFGLMIFVIPKIGQIVKDLGGEDATLPPQTVIMLGISDFIIKFWFLFIGGAVGGAVSFRRYIKTPKGRRKWHAFLLKMPVAKTLVTKVAIARFSRTFASLMGAGVGMLDALKVTGAAIGNTVIESELNEAAKLVKNGKQLSEPLEASKVFPPIVSQMLSIGEETGQIDTILVKVADFYEEEVDAAVDGLSSIIEPIMIVFMGTMVGLIAASVMGPISDLANTI